MRPSCTTIMQEQGRIMMYEHICRVYACLEPLYDAIKKKKKFILVIMGNSTCSGKKQNASSAERAQYKRKEKS